LIPIPSAKKQKSKKAKKQRSIARNASLNNRKESYFNIGELSDVQEMTSFQH